MKNSLKISKEISLPLDVVTQTIAILAKRRAGKSYTMRRIVEQLFEADQQVILVDPKGDQWGIRSSSDGKKPGLPIVILGGEHGDAPLEVNSGEVVAKLVVEERVSVLLDISSFRKHEVATFMTIFLENLYRLKAQERYRTPVMLVIDEADAIAPQKPQKGEERMLGAAEDIVRRGGQRGIGCMLVTQRSAVLNKNVLTQAQMLVVLRTIAPQDLAAMKAWIDVHGTIEEGKKLMDSLPSLPVGDAWFWSPGWPTEEGIFQRTHVFPIETFDSSATPKPGEKKVVPKNLADVDLDVLKKQMAATIEKAKNDDPKLLKKKIAELESELKKKSKNSQDSIAVDQKAVDLVLREAKKQYDIKWSKLYSEYQKVISFLSKIRNMIPEDYPGFDTEIKLDIKPKWEIPSNKPLPVQMALPKKYSEPLPQENSSDIGRGEMAVLNAIAQGEEEGITMEHLAILTGYKQTSRRVYTNNLLRGAYIQKRGNAFVATQNGISALGDNFKPLPTGSDLREHMLRSLPDGEKKIFEVIVKRYPDSVTFEELIEATNYKGTSIRVYTNKLIARKIVEKEQGQFRMVDKLSD
jgi:hypothetical protein